ncbi:alpha/beta fold hydrolase [Microbacterium sp. P05]|uniref:alpha/beta fold hydrolase n=1 Tax=Microbacterium sp. P05 TaxID=3366948 RepID=UPI003745534C
MTRAQGPGSELEYRSFGTPGGERTVMVLRTGPVATTDPDNAITARRDVWIVAVELQAPELEDPPAYAGETPAESTIEALAILAERESGGRPIGLVAERSTGEIAILLASHEPGRIDRLALVGVPEPADALAGERVGAMLAAIESPTLLVDARGEGEEPPAAAWYAERLPHAEVDLLPPTDGALDGRPGLTDAWDAVLDHVAPGAIRG